MAHEELSVSSLLRPDAAGLHCPAGDFHIDPVRPVSRALITHGHSDHARAGHGHVLATRRTLDIMRLRMGDGFAGQIQAAEGTMRIGEVDVSFHPAGHVLGSAQIRVASRAGVAVVTGDYKRGQDPTAEPFEPLSCDLLVTEATFGLPVFRHPDPRAEIARLYRFAEAFPGRTILLGAYSLGKAQRVIRLLRDTGYDRPIYIHGAVKALCEYYQSEGIDLGELREIDGKGYAGEIVVAPPGAANTPWARRLSEPALAFASGWMQVRARARQGGVEIPMVISDHADWGELCQTTRETGAGEVWVTHGAEEALVRWCTLQGIAARPLHLAGREEEPE